MNIQLIRQLCGYKHYKVNNYNVTKLDNVYLCDCALKYNRDIKTECKHIKAIKNISEYKPK